MEEVDQIIFNSFVNIGCDFAEGLESLKQLTTENVIEAAVRCLKIINPEIKMSHILPPGMSARFRVGSAVAQACQSMGYRDSIGYQTFLYSSETDIRKIFMFLIEKLPRKEGVKEDEVSTSLLKRRIGSVLREQYSALWMPPYCTEKKCCCRFQTTALHIPSTQTPLDKALFVHKQVSDHAQLTPSILELNITSIAAQSNQLAQKEAGLSKNVSKTSFQWKQRMSNVDDEAMFTSSFDDVIFSLSGSKSRRVKRSRFAKAKDLQSTTADEAFRKIAPIKPAIPKKPTHLKNSVKSKRSDSGDESKRSDSGDGSQKEEVENEVAETEEERFQREEMEMENLLKESEQIQAQHKEELMMIQSAVHQMKIEINQIESSKEEENEKFELKKKTVYLLPNADESMVKLKNLIDKNSQRLISLGKMWEERRIPLINELRELNDKCSRSEFDVERKLEEIKELRKRMKETSEETKRKEQMLQQLTNELSSMKRDISRQSYTKRILEIVSSIHKQREEIERVIVDMKMTQKTMNQLKGRADRTFTAVDEIMFQDAKKDENIRQAYKFLVALHDNCAYLLDTVNETGAILREIRELEDQIDTEKKKNAEENLKKILKDLKEMKKENADLMSELKQG